MSRFRFTVAILTLLLATVLHAQQSPNLLPTLEASYKNKIRILRGFYLEDELSYDSQGIPKRVFNKGPWTLGEMAIEAIKISDKEVRLEGPRIGMAGIPKNPKLAPFKTQSRVIVKVDRDASAAPDAILASIEKVFYGKQDRISDEVPDIWNMYFGVGFESVAQDNGKTCERRIGFAYRKATGEIDIPCEEHATSKLSPAQISVLRYKDQPYHVNLKGGATPPKVVFSPDPLYEPLAKLSKYQGTSILQITVTPMGTAEDVVITRALGFGLDERGVEAVRGWKFSPSLLNGVPVPVVINVEVNFRLY